MFHLLLVATLVVLGPAYVASAIPRGHRWPAPSSPIRPADPGPARDGGAFVALLEQPSRLLTDNCAPASSVPGLRTLTWLSDEDPEGCSNSETQLRLTGALR